MQEMKEKKRTAHTTNNSPVGSRKQLPKMGLAMTHNIKTEKIKSIPCKHSNCDDIDEPRKEESEILGPGTYNPNPDAIHR